MNDVSERAFQLEHGGDTPKGRSCDTFAPLGPWLVTKGVPGMVRQISPRPAGVSVRYATLNKK